MSQISPEYQLSILTYVINRHTHHEVRLLKVATFPEPRWLVMLDGSPIKSNATFEETRKALMTYLPEDFKEKKTR